MISIVESSAKRKKYCIFHFFFFKITCNYLIKYASINPYIKLSIGWKCIYSTKVIKLYKFIVIIKIFY